MTPEAPNTSPPSRAARPRGGGREHAVLARRLEELRDPDWVRGVIGRALSAAAGRPVEPGPVAIEYCKIKPNRDINAALRLGGDAPGASRLVSMTIYGSLELAAARFAAQAERLDGDLAGRPELRGFNHPAILLEDLGVIVRLFPADPGLCGLAAATDARRLRDLLAASLPARLAGSRPADLRYQVLHYKPGRSCSLHYKLDLHTPAGEAATWHAYGKVYRDDRGDRCAALLRLAWGASTASGPAWRAARPVLVAPRWRMLVQEAVAGRQFRHVFGDLTHDRAAPAELDAARAHLRSVAAAIVSMQAAFPPPEPHNTFAALLAAQEKNLAYLARSEPALARRIARIRRELRRLEPLIPAGEPVFSHGDLAHGNVLIDPDDPVPVGIIDFDRAGRAEAPYDVAYFLTHLCSFGIRHPRRQAHVGPLCEDFRSAWLSLAPRAHPARLALYEALDFASYVLRNFRKQSHQAGWVDWAHGQVEAATDRLAAAAAGAGGAGAR